MSNSHANNAALSGTGKPDWHGAASDLIQSFMQFQEVEQRLRILDKLCQSLDDQLYPALLQILLMVEKHGDQQSRTLVAETLAHGVCMQRLPEGRMNAWGSSVPTASHPFAAQRSLGPVEFLCCWYAQPSALSPLSASAFGTGLSGILSLINACEQGKQEYQQKLLTDASDPLSGALSMKTRSAVKALAQSWQHGHTPEQCTTVFTDALGEQSSLSTLQQNPFF